MGKENINSVAAENSVTTVIEAVAKASALNPQDEAKKQRLEHLKEIRIRLAENCPEPRFFIANNGVGALSCGNIHAIKGKPKNGKSQLVSIFAAVALGAKFGGLAAVEKELNVVLFDTMQSKESVSKLVRNTHRLLGWSKESFNLRFKCYMLSTDKAELRRREIIAYIRRSKPDLVFIDELVDLSHDLFDVEESQKLIRELMKVAREEQCAIVLVLNDDMYDTEDDLETLAEMKCTDVFSVSKNDQNVFLVSEESQNAAGSPFTCAIDKDGTHWN